jgi:hypothetical protein
MLFYMGGIWERFYGLQMRMGASVSWLDKKSEADIDNRTEQKWFWKIHRNVQWSHSKGLPK